METFYCRRGKRVVDISFAALGLVVTAPIQLGAGLGVLATMGLPVLFRQQRPGLNGRPFTVLKIRTMTNASDSRDLAQTDAARLTRLGAVLRATSIDELPELINVLRGDMSLVGPRPLLTEYLPLYSTEQGLRHDVRPGITGWAQVNGRNELSWDEKFALDIWYVDHVSFAVDLRILWMTVRKVLHRQGIAAEGHVTAPRFVGSGQGAASLSER